MKAISIIFLTMVMCSNKIHAPADSDFEGVSFFKPKKPLQASKVESPKLDEANAQSNAIPISTSDQHSSTTSNELPQSAKADERAKIYEEFEVTMNQNISAQPKAQPKRRAKRWAKRRAFSENLSATLDDSKDFLIDSVGADFLALYEVLEKNERENDIAFFICTVRRFSLLNDLDLIVLFNSNSLYFFDGVDIGPLVLAHFIHDELVRRGDGSVTSIKLRVFYAEDKEELKQKVIAKVESLYARIRAHLDQHKLQENIAKFSTFQKNQKSI